MAETEDQQGGQEQTNASQRHGHNSDTRRRRSRRSTTQQNGENPPSAHNEANSDPNDVDTYFHQVSEAGRVREEFHSRPRLTQKTRPLILTAPVLDRPEWSYSMYSLLFCMRGNDYSGQEAGGDRTPSERCSASQRKNSPFSSLEPKCSSACGHFFWRMFCLRCSVVDQTRLLFLDDEKRGRVSQPFGCECLLGNGAPTSRTVWTMCLLDFLTCGCPCGCCYHGMGTTLHECRLRYMVRCRYRISGIVTTDFYNALCCPLLAVDQQGLEMKNFGLIETRDLTRIMC
ncbi:hypothetical protein ERJ75_000063500 [Trypanosoma vivax]|uniref:PLAC8 family protein n=1 Tax=Trypanosoma vivax (strain Y486) TaxID=1055687 RepID=G0TVK3_TRYVY|nr:hypothetical protein TRVL_00268 [Trypanosoma vivax]KAH8620600.1 hypothetical protein ERJ75_000063500 [Trypanosoma vivax]CCC47969.1 conserved hypothetical protein [Trypanosoma vivax Y486]